MNYAEIATWTLTGLTITAVLTFAAFMVGYWLGERRAGTNYRTLNRVNSGQVVKEHIF